MARGLWHASDRIAAQAAERAAPSQPAPATEGPRLVWQVGPQPATVDGNSTAVARRAPLPRSRRETTVAAAVEPQTTASVPWPVGAREDRVPSDLMLAYAATPTSLMNVRPAAAPMGALSPGSAAASTRPKKPARSAAAPTRLPAIGRLTENPWLRGIIVAPSMQAAMGVSMLGTPNYRALAPLLHKPSTAVANGFADDPEFGLSYARFTGRAVSFVPTIGFGRITARLN